MVMGILKDTKPKVIGFWNIYAIITMEETTIVHGPSIVRRMGVQIRYPYEAVQHP
jgi:hypothetical protein